MLIDQVLARSPSWCSMRKIGNGLSKVFLKDAIVFRVEESLSLAAINSDSDKWYSEENSETSSERVPYPIERLPYGNMVIHFTDGLMWCVESEVSNNLGRQVATIIVHNRTSIAWLPAATDKSSRAIAVFIKDRVGIVDEFLRQESPLEDDVKNMLSLWDAVIGRFLTFLSCKNIRTITMGASEKLQRSRIKKGKLPLVSYRTLEICAGNPSNSVASKGLWTNRVHLCRGHHAEYGIGGRGLLFGKYAGRFWIPPHAKGDKKQGVVVKDYLVPMDPGDDSN